MKLYINEKLVSLHNKFYVKDESDNDVYEIASKVVSIADNTTIYNMKGEKVASIIQELLHLAPVYNVYIDEKHVCKVSKRIQLFRNDYTIDNGYKIEGDVLALNFKILDENNVELASIKKKFISIGDRYEIDIIDESKTILLLSIIVAIVNDNNRGDNHENN